MTLTRRLSKCIALATVAASCVWTLGCGDQGSKAVQKETSGDGKKYSREATTTDGANKAKTKNQAGVDLKTKAGSPADTKAKAEEAGSSTSPGGGVETP